MPQGDGTLIRADEGDLVDDIITGEIEGIVVNPSKKLFSDIIYNRQNDLDSNNLRVIAEERFLKEIRDEFITASKVANLIEANKLVVRKIENMVSGGFIITKDKMSAIVYIDDNTITTAAQDTHADAKEIVNDLWDSSEEFNMRVPPISEIYDTLEDKFGTGVKNDYKSAIDYFESPDTETALNSVTLSILIGAKNNIQLYKISKWGEDIGLASKATFSRMKTSLEDEGLIETEKIPIEVGRPRLKLKLTDEIEDDMDNIIEVLATR